ncbi:hypothetical protein [Bacillus solitudinis]|uniref:hypothetical protein n=1 Tax=Bacillus solitudinis TaxID=2014074 RepID=UPI000C2434F1|nr:hypothetical protein [Bacillus solitudinis]
MEKRIMLLIPGGFLIGLGIGLALNNPAPGMFIGLGIGFIIIAVYSLIQGNASNKNNNIDH